MEPLLLTGCITREAGGTNFNPAIQPNTGCMTEDVASKKDNMVMWTASGFIFSRKLQFTRLLECRRVHDFFSILKDGLVRGSKDTHKEDQKIQIT